MKKEHARSSPTEGEHEVPTFHRTRVIFTKHRPTRESPPQLSAGVSSGQSFVDSCASCTSVSTTYRPFAFAHRWCGAMNIYPVEKRIAVDGTRAAQPVTGAPGRTARWKCCRDRTVVLIDITKKACSFIFWVKGLRHDGVEVASPLARGDHFVFV